MVKWQQNFTECGKTELVIFKHQRKKLDSPIKIKLNRKRLYPSKSVKYLGNKIDGNLNRKQHIHDIAIKLNKANALLSIIRNHVNKHILRTIYFPIFDSHINYANLIWGQNLHALSRIIILQKKALRIMNFQSRDSHSSPLFKSNHTLKLEDKILIENIIFINKQWHIQRLIWAHCERETRVWENQLGVCKPTSRYRAEPCWWTGGKAPGKF